MKNQVDYHTLHQHLTKHTKNQMSLSSKQPSVGLRKHRAESRAWRYQNIVACTTTLLYQFDCNLGIDRDGMHYYFDSIR